MDKPITLRAGFHAMGPPANGSGPRGSSPVDVFQVPWLTWLSMWLAFCIRRGRGAGPEA